MLMRGFPSYRYDISERVHRFPLCRTAAFKTCALCIWLNSQSNNPSFIPTLNDKVPQQRRVIASAHKFSWRSRAKHFGLSETHLEFPPFDPPKDRPSHGVRSKRLALPLRDDPCEVRLRELLCKEGECADVSRPYQLSCGCVLSGKPVGPLSPQ